MSRDFDTKLVRHIEQRRNVAGREPAPRRSSYLCKWIVRGVTETGALCRFPIVNACLSAGMNEAEARRAFMKTGRSEGEARATQPVDTTIRTVPHIEQAIKIV